MVQTDGQLGYVTVPVFLFFGEISSNFHLENTISSYTKDFLMGKKKRKKKDPNSPDFEGKIKIQIARFL
jgi:adenine-specific DNA methylase